MSSSFIDNRIRGLIESLPDPIEFNTVQELITATLYALAVTINEHTMDPNSYLTYRRVFIQDFAAALNRRHILSNENYDNFVKTAERCDLRSTRVPCRKGKKE